MSEDFYEEDYEDGADHCAAYDDYVTCDNREDSLYEEGYEEGCGEGYENGYEEGCEEGYESGYEDGYDSADKDDEKEHTDTSSSSSDPNRFLYGAAGFAAGYAAARKAGAFHRPPERRKPRILVNPSYTRYPESEDSKLESRIEFGCGVIVLIALIFLLFSC